MKHYKLNGVDYRASAPELLEALQEMCEGWKPQNPTSKYFITYGKAQAAIAKATT